MKKSDRSKWQNVIQQMVGENYQSISDDTKTKLFKVSNAIFSEKKL